MLIAATGGWWHYSWARDRRDNRTLNAQILRAQRVTEKAELLRKQRFVKISGQTVALDDESINRARPAAGFKGYVTNIAPEVMDGHAVVAAYHDLRKVEQSFADGQIRPESPPDLSPHP